MKLDDTEKKIIQLKKDINDLFQKKKEKQRDKFQKKKHKSDLRNLRDVKRIVQRKSCAVPIQFTNQVAKELKHRYVKRAVNKNQAKVDCNGRSNKQ